MVSGVGPLLVEGAAAGATGGSSLLASLAPSLVKGGLNLLGGLFGSKPKGMTDEQIYQKQYEYALALQNSQNAWSESMWNKNNEYNTPLAQRERLEAAGMNPNLAYGSLSGNVAQQANNPGMVTLPKYQNTQVQRQQAYIQSLDVQSKVMQRMNENALLQSQSDLVRQQAETESTRNELMKLDWLYQDQTFEDRKRLLGSNIDESYARQRLADSQTSLNNINAYLAPQYFKLTQRFNEAQISQIKAQINYYAESLVLQGKMTEAEVELKGKQALTEIAKAGKIDAEKAAQLIRNKFIYANERNEATKKLYESIDAGWKAVQTRNNSGPNNRWQYVNHSLDNLVTPTNIQLIGPNSY